MAACIPPHLLGLLSPETLMRLQGSPASKSEDRKPEAPNHLLACCKTALNVLSDRQLTGDELAKIQDLPALAAAIQARKIELDDSKLATLKEISELFHTQFPEVSFENVKSYFMIAIASTPVQVEASPMSLMPVFSDTNVNEHTLLENIRLGGLHDVDGHILAEFAKKIAVKVVPKIYPRDLYDIKGLYGIVEYSKRTLPRQKTVGDLVTAIQEVYVGDPVELNQIMTIMEQRLRHT